MINIVFTILFCYLAGSVLYLAFFSIAGLFNRPRKASPANDSLPRIAVYFPVYKEDAVILSSVSAFAEQTYPRMLFDCIVIADSLKEETIWQLKAAGCTVLPFHAAERTKAKALRFGLEMMASRRFDLAVVMDADNTVAQSFLSDIVSSWAKGTQAAQCQRTAKNTETSFALLDAASEGINNHIFRKGHRSAGLSAGLIGSGMVFNASLLTDLMREVDVINGFDKELEFLLFRRGVTVEYFDHIQVFDEKVSRADVFQHQRTRWAASQWNNLKKHWTLETAFRSSLDFKDKYLQMLMPPRLLLLSAVMLLASLQTVLPMGPAPVWWFGMAGLLVLSLAIAIPARFVGIPLLRAAGLIPSATVRFLLAFTRIGNAQRRFLHTPHGFSSIPEKG